MNGVLLVDKPTGRSSHSVVAEVRRVLGTRKVGHAGTLDPMASGLLVVGVGTGTRLLTFLVGLPKGYQATVRLGVTTITEDVDGEVVTRSGIGNGIDPAVLTAALAGLQGTYRQRPSSVSAIKVAGRRAYDRVRAGEEVSLEPREVTVGEIAVVAQRLQTVDGIPVMDISLATQVSSGTYIRALARDLGEAVGTGAHLIALRRTSVGPFDVAAATPLAELTADADLLPLGEVASAVMPTQVLAPADDRAVSHGQRITAPTAASRDDRVALLSEAGDLRAVAQTQDGRWRYLMVVPPKPA